ncbi:MAG TPA: protein kinase, partial [Thermoanaerobaculia bacterium]|nr:protein kinase [Thermoanaerobaculia bacterium]
MFLEEGSRVGRFEIRRLLGSGGMGSVYLAHDTLLLRQVALKVIRKELLADEENLLRFRREAQAASALNHPNIVTVFDIGEADGQPFLATEFVEGSTLRERMSSGPLRLAEALDTAIQAAAGLAAAAGAGVVHRDIKPENLMRRRDGVVKVLDFGLAKVILPKEKDAATHSSVDTVSNALIGTVRYMSPEQLRCEDVDGRTDVFSLGVVFYEMVTGRLPFAGRSVSDTIVSVLTDPLVSMSDALARPVPKAFEAVVSRALARDRDRRFPTAADFVEALLPLRNGVGDSSLGGGGRWRATDEALRSMPALPHPRGTGLPPEAGELVGREADVERIAGLIDTGARLVTLTGPGGTGKTRLALAVARRLANTQPYDVFFAPLASVTDPDQLLRAAASAVGVPP